MNNIEPEILDIAYRARVAAMKHPDSNPDLTGWCAICSYHIFKAIKNIKKKVKFAEVHLEDGESHCFVIYDTFIIDVTATQFDIKEDIVIEDIETIKKKNKWFWDVDAAIKCSTIKKVNEQVMDWYEPQNPLVVDFSI